MRWIRVGNALHKICVVSGLATLGKNCNFKFLILSFTATVSVLSMIMYCRCGCCKA